MKSESELFWQQFNGNLKGMLRWEQLDALWQQVRGQPDGWYVAQLGQDVPDGPT